jgi:branched-chain amino acid transport system permease protein
VTNYLNQLSLNGVISFPEALSPAKMQRFIFGAILIIFAIYRPQGLIPAKNPVFDEGSLKEGAKKHRKEQITIKPDKGFQA